MTLWLLGLGLALLSTVNAESECSKDFSQIQGKWYVSAIASSCEHFLKMKEKAKMTVAEITVTEENKLKIIADFPKKHECKKIEMDFEKRDDGTYYHKSDWGEKTMEIASTDCETYALIVVKMQKKGKTSHLVAMYTKERKLSDELKKMFLERGRGLEIKDNQMIFPTEVACQNEA